MVNEARVGIRILNNSIIILSKSIFSKFEPIITGHQKLIFSAVILEILLIIFSGLHQDCETVLQNRQIQSLHLH